jgi:hypothetical protein
MTETKVDQMLPTSAMLPFMKTHAQPLALAHKLVSLPNTQRRLAGRVALVPEIDLDAHRFRAVIDWIEFKLHFARKTQVQHVQSVLRKFLDRNSFIDLCDKGPGDVFSICTIKVQEPKDLAVIAAIHRELADTFVEASKASVTAMEISVDAYPDEPTDLARATLLGAMQRTIWTGRDIWTASDSRPRSVFGKGVSGTFKLAPPSREEALAKRLSKHGALLDAVDPDHYRAPAIDGTLYLGAKSEDLMIRVMEKVIDGQRPDGTFIALTDEQKRVRIEATLKGPELLALGVTDIASLRQFSPQALHRRFFQFRLPTFSLRLRPSNGTDVMQNTKEVWRARTYLTSGIVGLMTMDHATALSRSKMKRGVQKAIRVLKPSTQRTWAGKRLQATWVSWDEMNRKVRLALRDLEKREATAWKRMGL